MPTGKRNSREYIEAAAIRDFGTTNVPVKLRAKARALARELNCTPREALPILESKALSNSDSKSMAGSAARSEVSNGRVRAKMRRQRKRALQSKKLAKVAPFKHVTVVQGGLPSLGKRR